MAEEKVQFPAKVLKYICLGIAGIGVTLYFSWMFLFLIPDDPSRPFDIGVFSISLCIFLFGVGGTWLNSSLEKKQKAETKASKQ